MTDYFVAESGDNGVAEDCVPANQMLDPDEVVTVSFALKNVGTANRTNLTATLEPSGGVVVLSGPQVYGALAVGGPAVARSFTCLSARACGEGVTTALLLEEGSLAVGLITNHFSSGRATAATNSYANATPISIPTRNDATPYPSTVTVTALTNPIRPFNTF